MRELGENVSSLVASGWTTRNRRSGPNFQELARFLSRPPRVPAGPSSHGFEGPIVHASNTSMMRQRLSPVPHSLPPLSTHSLAHRACIGYLKIRDDVAPWQFTFVKHASGKPHSRQIEPVCIDTRRSILSRKPERLPIPKITYFSSKDFLLASSHGQGGIHRRRPKTSR